MAIQFRCTSCGDPIEVDDEHAGQTAACPYCKHLVRVPAESTYTPDEAVPARPAPAPQPGLGQPWQPPPIAGADPEILFRRRSTAIAFGNGALACTVLMIVLVGAYFARVVPLMMGAGLLTPTSQPSPQQVISIVGSDPWAVALPLGATFFGIAGLVLGIVSMVQRSGGNWRGITSIVICGLWVLCQCAGVALGIVQGLTPGA